MKISFGIGYYDTIFNFEINECTTILDLDCMLAALEEMTVGPNTLVAKNIVKYRMAVCKASGYEATFALD